jgi:riboflavin kinase / FMN adenylyltransferase
MGSLVVIGNFDGVHRGHRAVLEGSAREASERGLALKVLTFHPHPAEALGRKAPPRLTSQPRKRELIRAAVQPTDIEIVEQRFDMAYASQSPAAFALRLRADFAAERVVVGKNFRFGKGREGDFDRLVELGREHGFSARSETLHGDETGPWSSTRVRAAIARGDLADARHVLGRPHMLSGTVVHGKQLGRTIGFPTANLGDVVEALPLLGVYACVAEVADGEGFYRLGAAAVSIGLNPTTDSDEVVKIEAYVLDFAGDLYGKPMRLQLLARLRGEARFDSLDTLVAQIGRDVEATRQAFDSDLGEW